MIVEEKDYSSTNHEMSFCIEEDLRITLLLLAGEVINRWRYISKEQYLESFINSESFYKNKAEITF